MIEMMPWLITMAVLMGCSAFFSASEAAMFSLRPRDLQALQAGSRSERLAAQLLDDPERLLSAVLFWNLVVNIAYFVIATIAERELPNTAFVWPLRIGSLLMIIFMSEMLPKTVAVLVSRQFASLVSVPLALLVRIVDPLMPFLLSVMQGSRRLIWPGLPREDGLGTPDMERAIKLSTTDAKLLDQERTILENIVSLSDLRADETMRPSSQLQVFRPPVRLEDLQGSKTRSGYLFLTDGVTENISEAVRLESIRTLNEEHLEASAEAVVYVPWCTSIADVTSVMAKRNRDVAAVVNEHGETIGVITGDDLMDVLFTAQSSRSRRLLNREPIQQLSDNLWQATGMTNLRRLSDYFETELPTSTNKTMGGVIQEALQRVPQEGDRCEWGPFTFTVIGMAADGQFQVQISQTDERTEAE